MVSISLMLPYSGVDHAGGELLLSHYRVLARRCERLDAIAIDLEENMAAEGRDDDIGRSYRSTIVRRPRWRRTLAGKVVARLWLALFPVLPDIGIYAAFSSSDHLRARVRDADIVELQWFEYFFFAGLVKKINPRARVVGFVHDVPVQKWERRLSGWPAPLRRGYLAYISWLERRVLQRFDEVVTLSSKDAALVAQRSKRLQPVVLDPPLAAKWPGTDTGEDDVSLIERDLNFGFIGAFQRAENDDAARWLLTAIWPSVAAECPDAKLYLVGSRPSPQLRAAASELGESVVVTGYVDEIDAFYARFSTVVIPLRYGAGVKFKTISAILAGKNIVATPVAVEGTLTDDMFFAVSDSAEELAHAMVTLAREPAAGRDIVEAARREVGSRYSLETYARTVVDTYGM
jgi:glycosyltransferase involved in cell wall biosynthesis